MRVGESREDLHLQRMCVREEGLRVRIAPAICTCPQRMQRRLAMT